MEDTPYQSIEHVGSTFVPGLCAKSVIDINTIVSQDQLQAVLEAITKDGRYFHDTSLRIFDRHAIKPTEGDMIPARNIYVGIDGWQAPRNHLAIRDLCRQASEVRDKYTSLETGPQQARMERFDEYAAAKTDVLYWILEKAGMDPDELKQIADMNRAFGEQQD